MTTATALVTAAGVRFKDPDNRVISAATWLTYLNQAYNEVNKASPLWPWLESSEETLSFTAGNRIAALPADVFQVNWAYDVTDDYRLVDQQGRGDQWHQDHLRSETGQPVTYRIRNSKMELFPIPLANTTVVCECVEYPGALSAVTTTVFGITGGAAGPLTCTGITVGDTIVSVVTVLNASPFTVADLTSEFSVTGTNTIDNTGGTATTSKRVVVTFQHQGGVGSPVYPSVYHLDLLDGMLALAYLDDGNKPVYDALWGKMQDSIAKMKSDMLFARSETNPPIRDTFWS